MLAGRKRKLPWILHPRGKLYTEVEGNSTFGQKMLERMGWKKGKGLGRNEDGSVDHVRVHYKNDSKGMGFTGSDGNWLGNQCDFDSLLADLQNEYQNTGSSDNPTSLEVKSKRSKRRVHYHKMIKGKDLSMRSKEELECIFGSNHRRLLTPDSQTLEEMVEVTTLTTDDQMFTSKDSVDSYFAKRRTELSENGQSKGPEKIKKKKKRKKEISNECKLEDDELLANTKAEPFVDTLAEDVSNDPCIEEERTTMKFSKRKKKKKKLKEKATNEVVLQAWSVEPILQTNEEVSTKANEGCGKETCENGVPHRKRKKLKPDANKVHEELKENCPSGFHLEKFGSKKQRRLFRKRNKFKKGKHKMELTTLTNYHAISVLQLDSNLKENSRQRKTKLLSDQDECEGNVQRPIKRVRFSEDVTIHTVAKYDEVRGGALREFLGLLKRKS